MVVLRKSTCETVWVVTWTSLFFHVKSFLLKRTTEKLWLFEFEYLADTFLKMNKLLLLFQRKQLTVFVANNNIWAFRQKLEFWKVCMGHWELEGFALLKDYSDEIHSDINKCDFSFFFLFLFWATPRSTRDFSSPTRDRTCAPCIDSKES